MTKQAPKSELKTDARHLSEKHQVDLRTRGMELMAQGVSQRKIADILGVHRQTVFKWSKRRQRLALPEAVQNDKRGPKSTRKILSHALQAEMLNKILHQTPRQAGLDQELWTIRTVGDLIEKRTKESLSRPTILKYIRAWGIVPLRSRRKELEKEGGAIKQWLIDVYPVITRRANAESAVIVWEDDLTIEIAPDLRDTGIPLPEEAVMMTATTNQALMRFRFLKSDLTVEGYLQFLEALLSDAPDGRIFWIARSSEASTDALIQSWAKARQDRIEFFYMPEINKAPAS